MNILITGCNGFIGKSIVPYLSSGHSVLSTNRKILDVLDESSVDEYFVKNKVDIVIHTAAVGGKRTQKDNENYYHQNLKMYKNLAKHRDKYKLMIVFGSGAEYDKTRDLNEVLEEDFDKCKPKDYYGLAKQEITKNILEINDNIYNIRIFNCFGIYEEPQRMIKNSILRYIKKHDIIIHKDKKMDFFYIKDLAKIINFLIENGFCKFKQINACYAEKHTLCSIAEKINNLERYKVKISVEESGISNGYCGSSSRLSELGLDFIGLENAIEEYYEEINGTRKKKSLVRS